MEIVKLHAHTHNGEVNTELKVDGEFFLTVADKRYRISIESDNNIMLTLINGQDAKITSDRGYPAIKLIGTRA
jgi:hypothetical protein